MRAVHGDNICYLVSYTYLWSPMIYLVSWSPMLMPDLWLTWSLGHAYMVSYAYLCGCLPVVSYAYALPPRPTWSPMPTWTPMPTYVVPCAYLVSYAYLVS